MNRDAEGRGLSCTGPQHNAKDFLALGPEPLGQCCPHSCPEHCPQSDGASEPALGEPLSVRQVAALIGVSAWTVRHRYVALGLPHFRTRRHGKLIFYKSQVIHWLLNEQQKGGTIL